MPPLSPTSIPASNSPQPSGRAAHYGPELAGLVGNSRLIEAQYLPLAQASIDQLRPPLVLQRALDTYHWFFYKPVLVSPPCRGRGRLRQLFEASRRTGRAV